MGLPALARKPILTIVSGPDKGTAYDLMNDSLTIGRDPENDISLDDPRASRRHAVVERAGDFFMVKDLGSAHGLMVAGQKVSELKLIPGMRFQVGSTEFQFNLDSDNAPSKKNALAFFGREDSQISEVSEVSEYSEVSEISGVGQNKTSFYIGMGVLIFFFLYLFGGDGAKKKTATGIRTESAIQAEIEAIEKRRQILEQTKFSSGTSSRQYDEAQALYIKCFRDYREGVYNQAISNCGAALALFPDHKLAQKYYKLARTKLDELVQYSLYEGRRYMEQNKYDLAESAYRNILYLLADQSTNKNFVEAAARLKEIQALLKNRY